VSPGQINFLMPPATALGRATVTVLRNGVMRTSATITIAAVSPGVFTANSDGRGAPAGFVVIGRSDGTQDMQPTYQQGADGRWLPAPIGLGEGQDQAVLVLFCTGVRNRRSLDSVRLRIGREDLPVQSAAPQGQYEGLDQINAVLPKTLAGARLQDLLVIVEGASSNVVQILFL
jgi:uncharacterized protein (TIGR03437 family)